MAYFLSPALGRLRFEINALWPHRDKTSDGWIGDTSHAARPSDHNPAPPDGIVRAIDIDEDLVAGLAAAGEAMPLVNQIIRDVRTRYVIYEGRIWTRDTGRWATYTGPNAHRHHVHVSVRSANGYDRDASPWGISRGVGNPIGGGGSIGTPNFPGAPAPITPEDDMPTMDEFLNTPAYTGGGTISEVLRELDRARINRLSVKRGGRSVSLVQDLADGTTAALKAAEQTGPVRRGGRDVSLRQEVADAKTTALALAGQVAGLEAALRGADLGAVREAARQGVADALGSIETTVTIRPVEGATSEED